MKLSEKLSNYRTDRPDEWTMDEFKRNAIELYKQLQQYKSIVKTVDPDNLPEGEVLVINECGTLSNAELFNHNGKVLGFLTGDIVITHYIEAKDIIKLLK